MRILGIDPGLRVTGYAVLSMGDSEAGGREARLLEAGVVRMGEAGVGISARLRKLHDSLSGLITELKPNVLVIEKLFAHYKHPATAILMAHARGVVCLLSDTRELPLVSIPSTHVKKAVTGMGHASKDQIQRMIQHALHLKEIPEPPDVADAIAIALAYGFNLKNKRTFERAVT